MPDNLLEHLIGAELRCINLKRILGRLQRGHATRRIARIARFQDVKYRYWYTGLVLEARRLQAI